MCGIGGVLGARSLPDPAGLARIFLDGLAHRGPDGEGVLAIPGDPDRPPGLQAPETLGHGLAGLLMHRRLSIIDLATGDQPMEHAAGGTWIVFNGEIYNYPALRQELAAAGARFRTRSDTEVILEAWRTWGVTGFRRLNGIFALAIYDARRRELVLARDPVGVKPLYWAGRDGRVAFASEIRPLRAAGLAGSELDPAALAQYLFYRFVPAPATLWRDVRKVRPGHALRFDGHGRLLEEADFAAPAPERTPGWSGEQLAGALTDAVTRQMIADVPVGTFLSGGLDSSLVATIMARSAPGLRSYAVGFPDAPGLPGELRAAAAAAEEVGTQHRQAELDPDGYFRRLPAAMAQVEEPLAHPGMLLQADLAQMARRDLKVVLTGQGADEPLGGYPRHQAARVLGTLAPMLGWLARRTLPGSWAAGSERLARGRRLLAAPTALERAAAAFSPLDPEEAGRLARGCGPEQGRAAVLDAADYWWRRAGGLDDTARLLYLDVRLSLAEDLLLVADKVAMAHSVEVRVPFLDLDYLRMLEAIPGPDRVRLWGARKQVQWDIARHVLSSRQQRRLAPTTRGPKRGFDVPVMEWFRGSGDSLQEFLGGRGSQLPQVVEAGAVRTTVAGWLAGRGRGYRMVLALFVLEHWLRNELGGGAGPSRSGPAPAAALREGL